MYRDAGGAMFGSVTLTTGATSFATNGTFIPNLKAAGISAGITALFAGIEGGIRAMNDERNFWTGEIIEEVGGYEGPGKFLNEKIPAGAKPTESGKIVELPSNKNYGKYGWTRKYANGDIKPHFGVDYAGEIGDPVYAIYEGKVVEIGTVKAYGPHHVRTSSIIGGKSYYVDYGHLSKSAVTVNQIVKQSSLIGYMGRQGIPAAFPTHVHIAVWRHIQGGLMGFVQPWWR